LRGVFQDQREYLLIPVVSGADIMVIPWHERIMWRVKAPFHVQLKLQKEPPPQLAPRESNIRGAVVRVFRGDGRLRVGDQVEFKLWICEPSEVPIKENKTTAALSFGLPFRR
jgi:hypothetical protein